MVMAGRLVFFGADPRTGLFPTSPFDLMTGGTLLLHDIDTSKKTEVITEVPGSSADVNKAVDTLLAANSSYFSVTTIHAHSVLGRLCRWRSLQRGFAPNSLFAPPQLRDLVEIINNPALLSKEERYEFTLTPYLELLDLVPVANMSWEGGVALAALLKYGN